MAYAKPSGSLKKKKPIGSLKPIKSNPKSRNAPRGSLKKRPMIKTRHA